ncbi:MAG: dGTPase [Litorilituus sp.]|jgi:dGTPase|nr:dGTPase [Litorilituus sp.]
MNYNQKLKTIRARSSSIEGRCFNEEMESDRGRAINSAAVRRLQQKTQVFPLETNAAVRSRLTHSLEVQQVGRYISKIIIKEFSNKGQLSALGIAGNTDGFISAIEVACLLHDIGNPAFGHFGEEAINLWGSKTLAPIFKQRFSSEAHCQKLIKDLSNFEGNAQALRLLHNLQSLNLTYTQLACLIKYTRGAYEDEPEKNNNYAYRKKKPGFYFSEKELFEEIKLALSIKDGCRFPLTYIMEAADDISYCIADIDDAIDKGILSVDQLHHEIQKTWQKFKEDPNIKKTVVESGYLLKIAEQAYQQYHNESYNKDHAYILTLRTTLVNDLSKYAAKRFIENHQQIFDGELDESLLDGNDEFNLATKTFKKVAINNIFNSKEIENLELKGYAVISGLLNIYTPLIELNYEEFKTLFTKNNLKSHPIESRLFHKLSSKHKARYKEDTKGTFNQSTPSTQSKMMELYARTRLVLDYISGMTDQFALEEFQNLTAII